MHSSTAARFGVHARRRAITFTPTSPAAEALLANPASGPRTQRFLVGMGTLLRDSSEPVGGLERTSFDRFSLNTTWEDFSESLSGRVNPWQLPGLVSSNLKGQWKDGHILLGPRDAHTAIEWLRTGRPPAGLTGARLVQTARHEVEHAVTPPEVGRGGMFGGSEVREAADLEEAIAELPARTPAELLRSAALLGVPVDEAAAQAVAREHHVVGANRSYDGPYEGLTTVLRRGGLDPETRRAWALLQAEPVRSPPTAQRAALGAAIHERYDIPHTYRNDMRVRTWVARVLQGHTKLSFDEEVLRRLDAPSGPLRAGAA